MFDSHFRNFAKSLEGVIAGHEGAGEDRTERQHRQVDLLIDLEDQFRAALIKHPRGTATYEEFIRHIIEDRRNILAARPYFRERQGVFSASISPALRSRDPKALQEFRVNYTFIAFVMGLRDWSRVRGGKKLQQLCQDVKTARQVLIDENVPLAIHRARRFWTHTPKSHLAYMDLIQIGVEGLINAIDKFVPPYTTVIRSVMIGRMTGNFIEEYTAPMVHFWPSDRKLIYRANKANRTVEKGDFESLATAVNEGLEENRTDSSEIQLLMAAASHVSSDLVGDSDGEAGGHWNNVSPVANFAAPITAQPDYQVENAEAATKLHEAIGRLSVIERKLLALKGVEINAE